MRRSLVLRGGAMAPLVALLAATVMASPVQAGSLVPFRATFHEHVTLSPCGATIACIHSRGVGQGLHLGKSTLVSDAGTVDFSTTPCATIQNPLATLMGANGDTITVSESATACPTQVFGLVVITGTYIVTGGTGRFAGATGGGTGFATSQTDTSCFCRATTTLTFSGDVSTPGSLN